MRTVMMRHGPSQGARALRREMGIKALSFVRTKFRPRNGDVVVNWGSTEYPFDDDVVHYINHPGAVGIAQNKLESYRRFANHGVPHPDFTTDPDLATEWVTEGPVVVRSLLRASGARGISIVVEGRVPPAPLYTRYIKKRDEYRVHIVDGEVIDVQQKRVRRNFEREQVHYQIRNAENGWVYCREGVVPPEAVVAAACRAVDSLALHFGAADVGYNRRGQLAVCYEVNTAPGMEGSTPRRYARALADYISRLRE